MGTSTHIMFCLVLLALLWEQLIYSDFLKCLWGFPEVFSFASKSILYTRCKQRTKHHLAPHDPHPADQGLHFEQILSFWLCFCAIGNKKAGNAQQNARRERLFIRKSALSAIFCCGFGVGKYYHRCRKSCLCPFCQKIFLAER